MLSLRDLSVTPTENWSFSPNSGLLGCDLRWVNVNRAFSYAREILRPAEEGAMNPEHRCWIIGMQVDFSIFFWREGILLVVFECNEMALGIILFERNAKY